MFQLGADDIRDFKCKDDVTATAANSGNDFPVIRYADILLILAEALNEKYGPNAAIISLINQVREKTGIEPLVLAYFLEKMFFVRLFSRNPHGNLWKMKRTGRRR